jgi:hypothetical protein
MCPTKNPITKIPTAVDMAVQGGSASSLYLCKAQQHEISLSLSLHDDLGSFRESQNQEFMEAKKSHRIIQWQWQQQI